MNKVVMIPVFLLFFLSSCSNNDNLVQYRALYESLKNSAMNMARENKRIYSEMENKLSDPQTKSKAEIWEPKTIKVGGLSSDINTSLTN